MTLYDIVKKEKEEHLITEINDLINKGGWRLQGGVSSITENGKNYYIQAVFKNNI